MDTDLYIGYVDVFYFLLVLCLYMYHPFLTKAGCPAGSARFFPNEAAFPFVLWQMLAFASTSRCLEESEVSLMYLSIAFVVVAVQVNRQNEYLRCETM